MKSGCVRAPEKSDMEMSPGMFYLKSNLIFLIGLRKTIPQSRAPERLFRSSLNDGLEEQLKSN